MSIYEDQARQIKVQKLVSALRDTNPHADAQTVSGMSEVGWSALCKIASVKSASATTRQMVLSVLSTPAYSGDPFAGFPKAGES